jgi:nicotinamidase-related amidase
VPGSPGAQFHPGLELPRDALVVSKGDDPDADAYSAFDGTGLAERLRALGVERLLVGGLALEHCVRATVLDALALGYQVVVLRDAVAAVDVKPGDGTAALQAMQRAGAVIADSDALR